MAKSTVKKSAIKKSAAKKKTQKSSQVRNSAPKKKMPSNRAAKVGAAKKKPVKKSQKPKTSYPVHKGKKITFKPVLTINDAKALYTELTEALQAKKDISIDASAVEMVDTAILQMLLGFINKSKLNDVAVEWVKPSSNFINRSETLNLTEMLSLKGVKA